MNPLSAIYAAGIRLRNESYDRRLLVSHKLAAPVVSVGSISAGGAGKTPFVIFLGEFLKAHGVRFDVLSRGYGRRSRGVRVVEAKGSPAEYGDEPLLIARRLACPVVVGENRFEAGRLAESRFGAQLHLLDDGFQHRGLARDLNVVLVTPDDLADTLLPVGRLREPITALERADVVALAEGVDEARVPVVRHRLWRVRRGVRLQGRSEAPVVFCGIARPKRFFDQVGAMGLRAVAHQTYSDHHAYSERDVEALLRLARAKNADGFITTEKDAMNLGDGLDRLGNVTVAQVTLEIEPADALEAVLPLLALGAPPHEKIRSR